MLFMVEIEVSIPHDADPDLVAQLKSEELQYALKVQEDGRWVHLWRVAGRFANVSIFDVESNDELHDILWNLPLYRFMDVKVTPLAVHSSSLAANR